MRERCDRWQDRPYADDATVIAGKKPPCIDVQPHTRAAVASTASHNNVGAALRFSHTMMMVMTRWREIAAKKNTDRLARSVFLVRHCRTLVSATVYRRFSRRGAVLPAAFSIDRDISTRCDVQPPHLVRQACVPDLHRTAVHWHLRLQSFL